MKKLLLKFIVAFSLLSVPGVSFAICNSPVTLGFDGNQNPDDDEFLYFSEKEYLLTKNGFVNSGKQNSGDGRGYECDLINSPSCGIGDEIEAPARHVFQGKVIPEARKYRCFTNVVGNDLWVVVNNYNVCSTIAFGNIPVGQCVSDGKGCKSLTDIDCSAYEKTDPAGTVFNGICREGPKFVCKAIECREGLHAENGICVANKEKDQTSTPDPTLTPNPSSCTQRYGCYNLPADKQKACVACCSVSSTVANWNTSTQVCECVNKSQTFNPDTKICSGGDTVTQPVIVPETPENYDCDINKLLELRAKHSSNNEIVQLIDDLIKKCNEGITEAEYNNLYVQITIKITNTLNAEISSSKTKISNAVEKLNKISANFETSVWKNADGNFNTSRLISDSVAGVVLGTAGGLITSKVVKKNQVESGFEDIQCTVGGQVVADWGDQFRVGIQ